MNHAYIFRSKEEMDMKFNPRNLFLEFIHHDGVGWFVEQGIPLSVETFKVMETMETQADLYATFTAEQLDMWREQKIIDKLQNSYNNKQDTAEDYPF
jgi:hypothetical protein